QAISFMRFIGVWRLVSEPASMVVHRNLRSSRLRWSCTGPAVRADFDGRASEPAVRAGGSCGVALSALLRGWPPITDQGACVSLNSPATASGSNRFDFR